MTSNSERKQAVLQIADRIYYKLNCETAAVVCGMLAGSIVFIGLYELLVVSGMENAIAAVNASCSAATSAVLVDTFVCHCNRAKH